MSLKKKLAMGAMTGALGLSLVGGGTYAAFTDTENVNASYAAGVLDIELHQDNMDGLLGSELFSQNVTNFKPGDSITKTFRVTNTGSLSISKVGILAQVENFQDGKDTYQNDSAQGESNWAQFSDMIDVHITGYGNGEIFTGTLKELHNASTQYDIAGESPNSSLPKENDKDSILRYITDLTDNDPVTVKLTFNSEAGNKFQGDSMDINFKFVAEQQDGKDFNDGDNVLDTNAMEGKN